jgi:serine protease Do
MQRGVLKLVFMLLCSAAAATTLKADVLFSPQPPFEEPVMGWGSTWDGTSYLGVETRDVTKERMGALKLKEERGAEIVMVDQDAPAGKAGLKAGDVVLTFNGQRIEGVEQLRRVIRETPPGRTVTLGISRDGGPMTIQAQLANRDDVFRRAGRVKVKPPKIAVAPFPPDFEIPAMSVVVQSTGRVGLMVENLTPQLGEFFGIKDGHGVLVRSVEKGSPAEKAGFKAGDVIVKVNSDSVDGTGDWRRVMREHRNKGGKLAVGIVREKREQTLSIELPTPPRPTEGSAIYLDVPEFDFDLDFDFDIDAKKVESGVKRLESELIRHAHLAATKANRDFRTYSKEIERAIREASRGLEKVLREKEKELEKARRELERSLNTI